jgi:hypothetical protein
MNRTGGRPDYPPDLPEAEAPSPELACPEDGLSVELCRPADRNALSAGVLDSGNDPLPDQVGFELRDRAENVQQKPTGRRASIDRLVEYNQINPEGLEFEHHRAEVADRAGKPIQLGDYQRADLPASGGAHQLIQRGSGVLAAGGLVYELDRN